jgi:hypothetical protein
VRDALVALAWCLGFVLLIAGMIALVRWAKRAGRSTSAIAGTALLMFGLGLAPDVERQRLEEARESKDKTGGQSGDPPNPEI